MREIHDYLNNVIPSETNNTQHPDKQGLNEDIFPVSAVTPDLYAGAVTKYIKPITALQLLESDKGAAFPDNTSVLQTKTVDMSQSKCKDMWGWIFGGACFINSSVSF